VPVPNVHKQASTRAPIRQVDFYLVYLPSYSPDFNRHRAVLF